MAKYRTGLPQLNGKVFLADGGLETTLIFHDGLDLPEFAAFDLLKNDEGRGYLENYYLKYIDLAHRYDTGFILESATWRASPDWAERIGYSARELEDFNHKSIDMLVELRDRHETATSPMVISGCVGPRGDGYNPAELLTEQEAEDYHGVQIGTFADSAADMISAITMTHSAEAIGIARAAAAVGMPSVISFTVETDGCLPTGQPLKEAIIEVDSATDHAPAYFMINCAHPDHFEDAVSGGASWLDRIGGIRANASRMSHAELDQAEELDDGNPVEFGHQYGALKAKLNNLRVVGGCCGTDHRHVEEICKTFAASGQTRAA
ncbi:MAG: homocysteine S-methyltransferase [Rhizobiales bacterium]|nr:homocysteine S-methyltransferase [Hyphomicrobiales bacterium]